MDRGALPERIRPSLHEARGHRLCAPDVLSYPLGGTPRSRDGVSSLRQPIVRSTRSSVLGRRKDEPHGHAQQGAYEAESARGEELALPRTRCAVPVGHELSRENTGTILRNGRHAGRYCRQCKRQQKRLARGWPAHEALAGGLGHRFRPRPHLESAQERGRVGRVHSLAPRRGVAAWRAEAGQARVRQADEARGEGRDEEGIRLNPRV